eukprot:2210255-Rhodomonas_salina.2
MTRMGAHHGCVDLDRDQDPRTTTLCAVRVRRSLLIIGASGLGLGGHCRLRATESLPVTRPATQPEPWISSTSSSTANFFCKFGYVIHPRLKELNLKRDRGCKPDPAPPPGGKRHRYPGRNS